MADTTTAKDEQESYHCKFYMNGSGMTMNVNKSLSKQIEGVFKPRRDYVATFDPIKETLTIFKPRAP